MAPFDSYKKLLVYSCTLFQPENVLEYGTGGSTRVFHEYSEAIIHSVEHSPRWFKEYRDEFKGKPRIHCHYVPEFDEYTTVDFGLKYDMIFVDGLCAWRTECMKTAISKLTPEGMVVLHDSERHDYNEGKALYKEILEMQGTTLYEPLVRTP
jgi:predicted O-methyltransferase YrrM